MLPVILTRTPSQRSTTRLLAVCFSFPRCAHALFGFMNDGTPRHSPSARATQPQHLEAACKPDKTAQSRVWCSKQQHPTLRSVLAAAAGRDTQGHQSCSCAELLQAGADQHRDHLRTASTDNPSNPTQKPPSRTSSPLDAQRDPKYGARV